MKYGYIRVSEIGMSVEEQTRLLLDADCDRLFTDLTQGNKTSQDALEDLTQAVEMGDTIVVAKLDRFGGSIKSLIELTTTLLDRGVEIESLTEKFDPETLQTLKQFDRERQKERNKFGLRSARARGKLGGRPRKLDKSDAAMAQSLFKDKKHSIKDICRILKVSRATLYRYLQ